MAVALEVYAAVGKQRHAPHGLLWRQPLLEQARVRRQPCERRLLALVRVGFRGRVGEGVGVGAGVGVGVGVGVGAGAAL